MPSSCWSHSRGHVATTVIVPLLLKTEIQSVLIYVAAVFIANVFYSAWRHYCCGWKLFFPATLCSSLEDSNSFYVRINIHIPGRGSMWSVSPLMKALMDLMNCINVFVSSDCCKSRHSICDNLSSSSLTFEAYSWLQPLHGLTAAWSKAVTSSQPSYGWPSVVSISSWSSRADAVLQFAKRKQSTHRTKPWLT